MPISVRERERAPAPPRLFHRQKFALAVGIVVVVTTFGHDAAAFVGVRVAARNRLIAPVGPNLLHVVPSLGATRQEPMVAASASSASTSTPAATETATATPTKRRGGGNGGNGSGSSNNADKARGAALLMEGASVWRGPAQILHNIDWRIEPNTKWGLVGSNGAGKSTLLQAIVGQVSIDKRDNEGAFVALGLPRQKRQGSGNRPNSNNDEEVDEDDDRGIGYLKQTAVAGSKRTVYEEAASGMRELNAARRDMEAAMMHEDFDRLDEATSRFEALGGYQQEQKVATVLKGLGFTNVEQTCDQLSGGWQMRVALARLLLSEPALCLLDEPGNHLDAAAKSWLATYLDNYNGRGALILVTHDASLLRSMQHIAELVPRSSSSSSNGGGGSTLQLYKSCTYEQYLQLKVERAEAAKTEYAKNVEKAAKLQAFVDRFGASATKASAAQSRVKQIEKMREQGLLDEPPDDVVAMRFKPTLVLADPPKAVGDVLLRLESAQVGRDPSKVLVSNVNVDITKGMRLLIRGPNGAGTCTNWSILHLIHQIVCLTHKFTFNRKVNLASHAPGDVAAAGRLPTGERAAPARNVHPRSGPGAGPVVPRRGRGDLVRSSRPGWRRDRVVGTGPVGAGTARTDGRKVPAVHPRPVGRRKGPRVPGNVRAQAEQFVPAGRSQQPPGRRVRRVPEQRPWGVGRHRRRERRSACGSLRGRVARPALLPAAHVHARRDRGGRTVHHGGEGRERKRLEYSRNVARVGIGRE
jgi:ATP-binding cassette, subfamily F, member 3